MSGVETDLVDDEGLCEDHYLDELVARAPSVDLLIRDVSNLPLFQGFTRGHSAAASRRPGGATRVDDLCS